MAASHSDILYLVHKLQHRVSILNLVADGMCQPGVRNERGNALGVLAEDMRLDLTTIIDCIEEIEAAA